MSNFRLQCIHRLGIEKSIDENLGLKCSEMLKYLIRSVLLLHVHVGEISCRIKQFKLQNFRRKVIMVCADRGVKSAAFLLYYDK